MRTTNEIIIAVKDCEPVTDQELKLALVAMAGIQYFLKSDLQTLVDLSLGDAPSGRIKMRAEFAKQTIDRMFKAIKTPPDKWLGEDGIPGTEANRSRMEMGKAIFKAATGQDL